MLLAAQTTPSPPPPSPTNRAPESGNFLSEAWETGRHVSGVISALFVEKKKQWLRKCAVEGGRDAGEILGSFWLYTARPRETRRVAQVALKKG